MLFPRLYFLKENEQLLIESFTSRRVVNGPTTYVAPPLTLATRRSGMTLEPTDYLRVRNVLTGELRNEIGPQLFFPGPNDEVMDRLTAMPLKQNQYMRLIDRRNGVIRVVRGEASVVLGPTEEILESARDGINIDERTAVLVRNLASGELRLVTTPQVFVPAPTEELVEVRKRVVLEDHEMVVIKERSGAYRFRRGNDAERSFFLAPYEELVQFRWSSGLHKDRKELRVTQIDMRPKFMWYDFEVRTQDNVELVIGITFFWQIVDAETMVRTTDDITGDVCAHARSVIIQAVSQASLERFLAGFNAIIADAVVRPADPFYTERGVLIHAVEVRSIVCKDAGTQRILQEIIQETTNRLNRIQQQESENEVQLRQINGAIEAEALRRQLLETRREVAQLEAQIAGGAESERVQAFLLGLGDLPVAEKLAIFTTLRKQEALQALSGGTAQLYFTPAEVDLHIESRT
ncbi:MAG: hypothetical protein MUD01_10405 [Chloroflexaceae bacterium]|jgi:hypothetical protein|nr:hypothetical protein [Chloroflexaceae bacterium]